MPAAEFQRVIREVSAFGDTVRIVAHKDGIRFEVRDDFGTGAINIRATQEDVVAHCEGEEVGLVFSLKYVNLFAKAAQLAESVILNMALDVPLVTEFAVGDSSKLGSVRFYLAPKLDETSLPEA